MVNKKKSIRLASNTVYFNPEVCRLYNTISSPYTYQFRSIKIEGYEARLYWQFRYCKEHNGQTFFYTLTYNDRHIPTYYGMNCFDYEDLRDLLTGGFRKQLLRKYGTSFKYFIGAELGDGKGERGLANNPHYHILFFLEDAHNERFPYKKIDPKDFRHLVRLYWQGFDEDEEFRDYRTAKYGISREGENDGLVTDYRACMYCAKYVTKDTGLKRAESWIEKQLREDCFDKYYDSNEAYTAFFHDYIRPNYDTFEEFSDKELIEKLYDCRDGEIFELKHRLAEFGTIQAPYTTGVTNYAYFMPRILDKLQLHDAYKQFVRDFITPYVQDYLREYRNRYCNKCRISQGVGDYALQFIEDKLNPTVQVPAKKGFKNRPISMYYYRKLFTRYIIDEAGSVRYIINEDGIRYKMAHLPDMITRKVNKSRGYLDLIRRSPYLYDKMKKSDINTQVFYPHADFLDELNYLLNENNEEEILKRYAEYKLIYEDRLFPVPCNGDIFNRSFPVISPDTDYLRFISTVGCSRNDLRHTFDFEDALQGYISYDAHPYFLRYLGVFRVLDLCADYFFVQNDDKQQKEAEEMAAAKRFHDKRKLNEFYAHFGI